MNKVIIATIGTRDIQLKKEYLTSDKKIEALESFLPNKNDTNSITLYQARCAGKIIYENFDHVKSYLSLPILEPTLKHLQSADELILVATNQPEEHPNDTLYFAEIAQKWIMQHYAKQYPKIEIFNVRSSDVIRLDSMYGYFAKNFNQYPLNKLEEANELYLHLVGGIDALNNALRLTCMYLYPEKLKPELQVNESNSSVIEIKSFSRFLLAQNLHLAEKFAHRYDYAAITQLNVIHKKIRQLAEYAHHRLAFNFKKCNQLLDDIKIANDEPIKKLDFDKNNPEAYLKELYFNLCIKFQQENYVDFLSRIFRLYEAYLSLQVKKLLKIDYESHNWKENFLPVLKKIPELQAFLDQPLKVNKKEIQLKYDEDNPSTLLLKRILEFFRNKKEFDSDKFEFLETIENLSGLRNQSIAAHNFKAVTKKEIEEKIKPLQIDDFFNKLKELLETTDADNPYCIINKKIKDMIERSLKYEKI